MRHLPIITATMSLALLSVSTSSFAADNFTYRAGQAYLKSAANNHTQCEAQCRGDAACRGWNFVRPNPRAQSGICEFNARQAVPVSSAMSISGEIGTSIDPLMSQANPQFMSGKTVRVGTPIVAHKPKKQDAKRREMVNRQMQNGQIANLPSSQRQSSQRPRRIVRHMPIPQAGSQTGAYAGSQAAQMQRQASFRRNIPAPQTMQKPDVRTPRVYGSVEAPARQSPQIQAPRQQAPRQTMRPQIAPAPQMQAPQQQLTPQQIYQQQMADVRRRGMEKIRQRAAQAQQSQQAPQQKIMAPIPATHNAQDVVPVAIPPGFVPIEARQARPSPQMRPAPQTKQSSLYGGLHDDLTTGMTSVPRPQTAPDRAANPDAPLSTSRAVPTTPVDAEALTQGAQKARKKGYPPISGLAGG